MTTHLEDCPFCGYRPDGEYALLLHMETSHAEGKSPFIPEDSASVGDPDGVTTPGEEQFADCPAGCGEFVALAELEEHLELHRAEEDVSDTPSPGVGAATPEIAAAEHTGYRSPYGSGSGSGSNNQENVPPPHSEEHLDGQVHARNKEAGTVQRWKQLFSMPSIYRSQHLAPTTGNGGSIRKRLGKSELGRFAHEDQMPDWLVQMLQKDGQVVGVGILPVLAQLLEASSSTDYAYLCHPATEHVSKLRKEGGFCGYRNIQMLSSFIIGTGSVGSPRFDGKIPSVFDIQDYIEDAWDRGINAQGRIETGGVKGSRKYIGTPEAQAMFIGLDVPCEATGFKDSRPGNAERKLLQHVEAYFESGDFDPTDKVRRTTLPPIYFQHRGHSLTIVGLEKRNNVRELLVFDPMFRDSHGVTKHIGQVFQPSRPDTLLKPYRRGNKYLRRFHEFEILKLTSRIPTATERVDDVA
ncbi:peptidase family C78-domain-containing protein [Xylariales sp. PMI_506]|nr:peptidase family C78-domain-containing protein [Xylariales sp. PMI_506]